MTTGTPPVDDASTWQNPDWPGEPLPHPWVTETGLTACNEPYYDIHTGNLSGHCRVPVAHWDRWRRPANTHKGDHQITWTNKTEARR